MISFSKIIRPCAAFLAAVVFCAGIAAAQVDVPRKTVAVTYPLGEPVSVAFGGTTRFPRLRGTAKVERKNKTGTKVNISLENLPRPYELGAAYTTYILWAITPGGQVERLGELKYRTGTIQNPRGEYTTSLQTFAMIVTAEPHYLVDSPSRAVILENIQPSSAVAQVENIQYFGNSSDYFRDPRVPEIAEADYTRTPVSILGARQAVAMAKYAGAERDATEEFELATTSLAQAETAFREQKPEESIDILARQAIEAGVSAEKTAGVRRAAREKRNEAARNSAEIRRFEDATTQAVRERDEARAELERERRSRELAERDTSNVSQQVTDLKTENRRLQEEIARLRAANEDAKIKLTRVETEREILENQRRAEERAARIRANAPLLIQSLKQFGTVTETTRGVTVSLPENLWTNAREWNFAPTADAKLSRLAQVLSNNPDYKFLVEAHTDDGGNADVLLTLTQERARLLAEKLAGFGADATRIEAKGLGSTVPLAANTTNANRNRNRRIEITFIIDADANNQSAAN